MVSRWPCEERPDVHYTISAARFLTSIGTYVGYYLQSTLEERSPPGRLRFGVISTEEYCICLGASQETRTAEGW